jgi:hypothetical protein
VTDFLSRVAARAVGASAAARPRVGGLFEPAGSAGDATLEVVEEEVVAPAPVPHRKETPVAGELGRSAAPSPSAPTAPVARRADPPAVPDAQQPARPPDVVAQSNYVPAPPHAIGSREAEPEPVHVARSEQSLPPPVVAAAPLTQARPAARDGVPSNSLLLGSPAPAREEPPVRVHIGRLEVHANVQPPAPERPRREPARPESLSLADYLRGKREVRS